MLRKVYHICLILLNKVEALLKKVPFLWIMLTHRQLRFKYRALRQGMKSNRENHGLYFNLRRNIHRIEKGLSYNNPKPVFAKDYILETIQLFKKLVEVKVLDSSTIDWAVSVLKKYFQSVDKSDKEIHNAEHLFNQIQITTSQTTFYPYRLSERHTEDVGYDSILGLSLQRRSIRYFQDRKIEEEVLSKLFEVAKLSPSACNRQSFKFLFFNDKETVDTLSQIPGGVSGYQLYNIIVVIGDYSGYFNERDVNAPIIDASLASMSFLYACETLGIGTVCINWPNLPDREKKIRKSLDLEKSEFVIMMIGLGYPEENGKIPYSKKRDNQRFLYINERIKR